MDLDSDQKPPMFGGYIPIPGIPPPIGGCCIPMPPMPGAPIGGAPIPMPILPIGGIEPGAGMIAAGPWFMFMSGNIIFMFISRGRFASSSALTSSFF